MSVNTISNNNSIVSRTKCCKVCKDAGEPENIYSSHYVKDREGNVTCPKLKAIVCLNCGKRGHTSSYCKTPSAKNMPEKTKKLPEPVVVKQNTKSKFDCLFEDDSDDEKPVTQKITHSNTKPSFTKQNESSQQTKVNYTEDFPSLSENNGKTSNTTEMKTLSYATMVAKPVEQKIVKQTIAVPSMIVKPAVAEPVRTYLKASEMDWAMEDSDDDSDEDF